MLLSDRIIQWIKEQVKKAGKEGVVVGLSGGIDSAVVACMSKRALGNNMLALVLPCKSNPDDVACASKIAKTFDIKTREVSLDSIFEEHIRVFPDASSMAKSNLKPRIRMAVLYYFANTLNYLVAGTGNKSELTIGYFTKYGDGGVDILPLGGLLKGEVRKIAEEIGIPREVIERPPSAGLWHGQTDEGEIGITYEELDRTILAIESGNVKGLDGKVVQKVKRMREASAHKRCGIPYFNK